MVETRPSVLVAGIGRSSFEELAPVLDRQKLEVVQVTTAEDSTKLAFSEKVDLVILDAEPREMGLADVVRIIRAPKSASRKASILVLAQPGNEDEARKLIGHGVNRVMLGIDPPRIVARQVAELLHIAPRTTLRMPTRVLVELADGAEEALGAVVNISATGSLIETDADLEAGQHVALTIDIAPEDEPLTVVAEVVRRTLPERDGVVGVGVRFLKFAGDARRRLDAILASAFGVPPDEVRTVT